MNWIEQLTGLDPDGGSGALEALYSAAVGALAVALCIGGRLRKRAQARTRHWPPR